MKTRRRIRSASAVAAATALIFTLMPTSAASAHGYVSAPMSRQAQCAAVMVECGGIRWEPQSVEGPKGLMSCSGGNSRFAELDDDSRGWHVAQVGNSLTFTWTLTAMHSTDNWEYFIGGQRIANFEDHGARPPSTVRHTVDLSGYNGRHTILARWNVDDTANAFYSCVDVNIR
ncbi:lytic polysaccharide monooxygenase auxiliary activity family 9 protein [Nocardiopsis halotolerans]|uniref:lytic polysaccharide monooxygenase auxiliary activity family 9 protein n=1 Tax=Nocardiopsis halotolerans TaxID=124252 RepID=UPI00034C6588|nr:lytic polysaccharide monooxygenase auxiliary activity family 9 protein [Nocardiopsis halotolerans]